MTVNIQLPVDLGIDGFVRLLHPVTEGIRAYTFLAHVTYDGTLRRAYLKVYDTSNQPKALLNELLGYLFAQAMNVPTPRAFLVDIPATELARFGLHPTTSTVRATGSLEAHDPTSATDGTAKSFYQAGALDVAQIRARLLKSPAGRALIAFDEAVGNPDRNIGNIIFSSQHGVVAIDHGCILSGPAWTPCTLNSAAPCPNILLERVLNTEPLTPSQKSSLHAAAEVLVEAYYEAMAALAGALGYKNNGTTSSAYDYVWWRILHLMPKLTSKLEMVA